MATYLWVGLMTGLLAFQGYGTSRELHTADEVTGMMRQRLDGVRSLAARYSVTTYAAVLDQRSETEGRLFLQRDEDLLRLEEVAQTIISDGESVWTYVPDNRQVIVSPAQESEAGTRPDEFLFDYTNRYRYDLEGRQQIDDSSYYILKLTAVAPTEGIPELRIWVDDSTWLTTKVAYTDDMGSLTTLRFTDFKLNSLIPPGLFKMTTPADVEWVDLR